MSEDLPLYKVRDFYDNDVEVKGILDCRQIGSLIFTDRHGMIIRIFASGGWKESELISEFPENCPTCRKPR